MDCNCAYQVSTPEIVQYFESVLQPDNSALDQSADESLEIALSRIPAEMPAGRNVMFRVILEGRSRPLHPLILDQLYRIGYEAVLNAFRHSESDRVEVEIEYAPKRLRFAVRDNGKGISPDLLSSGSRNHRGLSWMQQQAQRVGAKLNLLSRVATGTEVVVSIPGKIAYESQTKAGWFGKAFLWGWSS
jgi:signal transduction histidine kinase